MSHLSDVVIIMSKALALLVWAACFIIMGLHAYAASLSPMGLRRAKLPKNPKKRLAYAKELVAFCSISETLRDSVKVVIRHNALTLTWFREAGLDSKALDVLAGLFLEIEAEEIVQAA